MCLPVRKFSPGEDQQFGIDYDYTTKHLVSCKDPDPEGCGSHIHMTYMVMFGHRVVWNIRQLMSSR